MVLFQKKKNPNKINPILKLPFHFSEFQAKWRKHIKPLTAAAISLLPVEHSLQELRRAAELHKQQTLFIQETPHHKETSVTSHRLQERISSNHRMGKKNFKGERKKKRANTSHFSSGQRGSLVLSHMPLPQLLNQPGMAASLPPFLLAQQNQHGGTQARQDRSNTQK